MTNVRRWYVYLVCAITINAVVWSAIALLRNLLIPGMNAPETALAFEIALGVELGAHLVCGVLDLRDGDVPVLGSRQVGR